MDSTQREEFERFAVGELSQLLRYALMLTGDTELARDIVQDVMVKVFDRWPRVSKAEHPHRYVQTMLTRQYLSWRRRWSVRHVFVSADGTIEPPAVPDHSAEITETSAMWQNLTTLPRQQRAVLVLRYYQQLTDTEIAEVLSCSPATVRGYASRALATLRSELTPDGELPINQARETP